MAGLANLIPLIVLLLVVGVGGYVGWHIYQWSNELKERGSKHMEKKNMSFTKDGGLRVGVKEMNEENYADKTQKYLVNVWNNAELPNYKSRLGWNSTQSDGKKKPSSGTSSPRPSASRSNSSQQRVGRTSSTNLSPPASTTKRSASPVPGGWE